MVSFEGTHLLAQLNGNSEYFEKWYENARIRIYTGSCWDDFAAIGGPVQLDTRPKHAAAISG